MAQETVIQLDWATATGVASAVAVAIGAVGRFGWTALFTYMVKRDEVLTGGISVVADKLCELCESFEKAELQSRIDKRQTDERLIAALTKNTQALTQSAEKV